MTPSTSISPKSLALLLCCLVSVSCDGGPPAPAPSTVEREKSDTHSPLYRGTDVTVPLTLAWEVSYPEAEETLTGRPVIGGSNVLVPLHRARQSELQALDVVDGGKRWTFVPSEQGVDRVYLHAPPVVAEGRLYALFELTRTDGSTFTRVYALDDDGLVLWRSAAVDGSIIAGEMIVTQDYLVFCLGEAEGLVLRALLRDTGVTAFRKLLHAGLDPEEVTSKDFSPVAYAGQLIVPSRVDIRALNIADQEDTWRFVYPEPVRNGAPLVAEYSGHHRPNLLVPTVADDGSATMYALNPTTGALHWQIEAISVSSVGNRSVAGYFPFDSRVVFLSGESLFGISPGAGGVMWEQHDDGWEFQSQPAYAVNFAVDPGTPSVLMFATNQSGVYALHPFTGEIHWSDVPFEGGAADATRLLGGVAIGQGRVIASIRNSVRAYVR